MMSHTILTLITLLDCFAPPQGKDEAKAPPRVSVEPKVEVSATPKAAADAYAKDISGLSDTLKAALMKTCKDGLKDKDVSELKEEEIVSLYIQSFGKRITVKADGKELKTDVHKDIADDLKDALLSAMRIEVQTDAGKKAGAGNPAKTEAAKKWRPTTIQGWNIREISNADKLSKHATGQAVDIDPEGNKQFEWGDKEEHTYENVKRHCAKVLPKEVIDAFKQKQFKWGGEFSKTADPMHFER